MKLCLCNFHNMKISVPTQYIIFYGGLEMLKRVFVILITAIFIISVFGCNRTQNPINNSVISNIDDETIIPNVLVCKPGDILSIGQMCMDPGTDATFKVLDDGIASYTSPSGLLNEATDVLDATGQTLNNQSYNFIARKQENGNWKIEQVTSE